jgi:hypothetical protein
VKTYPYLCTLIKTPTAMKKYKVVLNFHHTAQPNQVVDGCLGNSFDSGKIQLYDRGQAIKKARMFDGKIEEVKGIHNVLTKLSVVSIPENAILDSVIRLLDEREAYVHTDSDLDEKMYAGHIFEDILGEQGELEGSPMQCNDKTMQQLLELAELVSEDYVLITKTL